MVGALVRSDIPQTLGFPSQSRGFSLRFVQPHREISSPLPWSHSPCGSALVLASPLLVHHPQASVPAQVRGGEGRTDRGTLAHLGGRRKKR